MHSLHIFEYEEGESYTYTFEKVGFIKLFAFVISRVNTIFFF